MLSFNMKGTTNFKTPKTQLGRMAIASIPCNCRGLAKHAASGFLAVFLLLLMTGSALGAGGGSSSGPSAFFTYQQAVGSGFGGPCGVAVDGAGDVFVADFGSNAINEILAVNGAVTANSTVTKIASSFSFNDPCDVKLDANGNLFVADAGSGNIYEITATNGAVSATSSVVTIDNFNYPSGLAFDASGNLYVAVYSGTAVYQIPASSGSIVASTTPVALPAPTNGWNQPWAVATDGSGDVFVTDYGAGAVYEVVAVSGAVTSSSAVNPVGSGFIAPSGVIVDSQGNVFVADNGNGTLNVISQSNGAVSSTSVVMTLVSGLGDSSGPYGLAQDGNGNVYVADYTQAAVYEISIRALNLGTVAVGSQSSVFPMTFTASPGGLLAGWSVLSNGVSGNVFADAGGGSCVKGKTYTSGQSCTINVKFTPSQPGTYSGAVELIGAKGQPILAVNLTGTGVAPQINYVPGTLSAPLTSTPFEYPDSIVVDGSGSVYIADPNYNSICKLPAGSAVCTWLGSFDSPEGVAIDGAGVIYVADSGMNSGTPGVYQLALLNGSYIQRTISTNFGMPTGLTVDGSGNIYVADLGHGSIYKLSAYYLNSYWQTTLATGLTSPWAVAVDGSGNVYVAGNSATFSGAADGNVYLLTPSATGYAVSTLGSGWVDPNGIAVDAAGAVFVADDNDGNGNGFVAILHQTSVAGVTEWQKDTWFSSSVVNSPEGIGLDQKGNLYLVDGTNSTRNAYKYDTADAPGLSFAATTVGTINGGGPQHLNVVNTGNAVLNIASVGFQTNFPEDTSYSSDGCAAGLSVPFPGSCSMTVDFKPTSAGTNYGVMWLRDNALNLTNVQQNLQLSGVGTATAAVLNAPPAGSILSNSSQSFSWTPVSGATGYTLWLGSSKGAGNLFNGSTTNSNITAPVLPVNGGTVYARLFTNFSGVWVYSDSTFKAVSPAALLAP
ncbi:MAG: NHL repeat-containing protein, partial [Terracidiphilus sp.]